MRTSILILTICFFSKLHSQTVTGEDSTVIKNKLMIESLKNRINAIDNNTNDLSGFQKELEALRKEVARQNDSINKLLGIINELKQYANNQKIAQKPASTLRINSSIDKIDPNSISDNDYNALKKLDIALQQYLSTCNCSPLFYKPYQVELDFKTITDLNEIIKQFESKPSQKIVIKGHADKSGVEDRNIALSKQRAEKLKSYLIIASDKIKKEDVEIEWHGSTKPISNLPANKKELNRRTEVVINKLLN